RIIQWSLLLHDSKKRVWALRKCFCLRLCECVPAHDALTGSGLVDPIHGLFGRHHDCVLKRRINHRTRLIGHAVDLTDNESRRVITEGQMMALSIESLWYFPMLFDRVPQRKHVAVFLPKAQCFAYRAHLPTTKVRWTDAI